MEIVMAMMQSTRNADPNPAEQMLNQAYDLTFGVELEFVFVFHEKLILGQLKKDFPEDRGGGDPLDNGHLLDGVNLNTWRRRMLDKYCSSQAHRELRQGAAHYATRLNQYYLSWAIKVRSRWDKWDEYNQWGPRNEGVRVCLPDGRPKRRLDETEIRGRMPPTDRPLRTYHKEPLEVAKEVLRTEGAHPYWSGNGTWMVDTYDGVGDRKPLLDFERWHLTNDFSLSALYPEDLWLYLRRHKYCPARDGVWSSVSAPVPSALRDPVKVDRTGTWVADPDLDSAAELSAVRQLQEKTGENQGNSPSSSVQRAVSELLESERPGPAPRKGNEGCGKRKRSAEDVGEDKSRKKPSPTHPPPLEPGQTGYPDFDKCKRFSSKKGLMKSCANTTPGDAYGIELVSSVLQDGNAAWTTINKACSILKGGPCDYHGAKTNDTCGLHVHLKPAGEDFDMPTLRHLCYVLFMYEAHIDNLHPPHRRASAPVAESMARNDFASNLSRLRYPNFLNARNAISSIRHPADLRNIMGDRKGLVVNFRNLGRMGSASGPRTLEFRQHEGVLRGEMVKHWVLFCMGLVRVANYMAHNLRTADGNRDGRPVTNFEEQCAQYPFNSDENDTMSVWDLFDMMRLPRDTWNYFMRRAAYNAGDPWNRGESVNPTLSGNSDDSPKPPERKDSEFQSYAPPSLDDDEAKFGDGQYHSDSVRRKTTPPTPGRRPAYEWGPLPSIEEEGGQDVDPQSTDPEILGRREYTKDSDDEAEPADGIVARPKIDNRAPEMVGGLQAGPVAGGGQMRLDATPPQLDEEEQRRLQALGNRWGNPRTPSAQRSLTEDSNANSRANLTYDDEDEHDDEADDEGEDDDEV